MELYDSFGIKFIKKDGVNTHFELIAHATVDNNITKLAEVFCLFTVGLFETDSVERKVVYKKDNKYFVDKIDNLCKAYFANHFCGDAIIMPEGATFFEHCGEDIIGHKKYYDGLKNPSDKELFKDDGDDSYDSSDSSDNADKILNVKPGVKLMITKDKCTSKAYKTGTEYGTKNELDFYDFNSDRIVTVDKIYNISKEGKEVPGNWGQYIKYFKESNKENKKETTHEKRYSIFDLDKFFIEAKISSNASAYKEYTCSFTPINSVHHAASMFARSCIVDYTKTSIESKLINTVTIKFTPRGDMYDIVTTYLGVDVL